MDLQPALPLVDFEQGHLWLVQLQQLGMELDTFRVRGARYHQCSTSQIHFTILTNIFYFLTNIFVIWTNTMWMEWVEVHVTINAMCCAAPINIHCTVSDHSGNECLWMAFVIRLLKLRDIDAEKLCDDRFFVITVKMGTVQMGINWYFNLVFCDFFALVISF